MTDEEKVELDMLRQMFAQAEAAWAQHEASIWHHQWMQVAMKRVAWLEAAPTALTKKEDVLTLMNIMSQWLLENNVAHYFCVDTGNKDDDGRDIACVAHALHTPKQFEAMHYFIEKSKASKIRETLDGPDFNLEKIS